MQRHMVDYHQRYMRLITDGTTAKPEYMRYYNARSPNSRDVGHRLNDVSPCTPTRYISGKIDNDMSIVDFVVHQSVEEMVGALIGADVHMDKMSNKELGVDAHDVPADGDCKSGRPKFESSRFVTQPTLRFCRF